MVDEQVVTSQEELKQIEADIQKARDSIVSKETSALIAKAKEEAKKEAEKEFLTNSKIKELEDEKEKLRQEQVNKEREAATQLEALKKKVDELTSSKAPINFKDPFRPAGSQQNNNQGQSLNLTEEQINNIEFESGKAFFGDEFAQEK